MKVIYECVFSKLTKVERLDKVDNLRKIFFSEYEMGYISNNLFEIFDELSLMNIDKETDDGNDLIISVRNDRDKGREIFDKFNEIRNRILNV